MGNTLPKGGEKPTPYPTNYVEQFREERHKTEAASIHESAMPANHGKPWTHTDIMELIKLIINRCSPSRTAELLGRTERAVTTFAEQHFHTLKFHSNEITWEIARAWRNL